ncbi:MAG: prepilin-type N-terminal cleavage/methylation domain-containing protein [Deferribacterales bacterium]
MDRKIALKGLTLIELLVVISILSIMLGIGVYSYNSYAKKRELENDIYKIYSLMNKARVSAFTEKNDYYIYLYNNGLEVIHDNNTDVNDGFIDRIQLKNKFISDNSSYIFSKNGFVKNVGKIYPEAILDVQYNCIKVEGMVYLGKMNGGNCVY